MIPVFWGRNRVYCKHDDLIDSWKDPTKLCQVQGADSSFQLNVLNRYSIVGLMGQFGLLSTLMWWASFVCNTLLSLFRRQSNYSSQRRKIIFFVQLTLALIIPGGLTIFPIVRGIKYTRNTFQTTLCTPSSYSSLFHLWVLPGTAIILIGTFASVFVIHGLYRVRDLLFLYCSAYSIILKFRQRNRST